MIQPMIIKIQGDRVANARQFLEMAMAMLDNAQVGISNEINFHGLESDRETLQPVVAKLQEVRDYVSLAYGLVPDESVLRKFEPANEPRETVTCEGGI